MSDHVTRWSVGAGVNELYMAQIDLLDTPSVVEVVQNVREKNGMRVALKDKIVIKGGAHLGKVDISKWINGYEKLSKVGSADIIRLHMQCDSEALSINGTTPWEEPRG